MDNTNEGPKNDNTQKTEELLKKSRALIEQYKKINERFDHLANETNIALRPKRNGQGKPDKT